MNVFVLKRASEVTIDGVYETLDAAKLACEATIGSGLWNQEDADQWTLRSVSDSREMASIVRYEVQQ